MKVTQESSQRDAAAIRFESCSHASRNKAGTKNGADPMYHTLNQSMDSYVAAAVPSGITLGDAANPLQHEKNMGGPDPG